VKQALLQPGQSARGATQGHGLPWPGQQRSCRGLSSPWGPHAGLGQPKQTCKTPVFSCPPTQNLP